MSKEKQEYIQQILAAYDLAKEEMERQAALLFPVVQQILIDCFSYRPSGNWSISDKAFEIRGNNFVVEVETWAMGSSDTDERHIPLRVLYSDNPKEEYILLHQEMQESELKKHLEEKKKEFESFWDQYL